MRRRSRCPGLDETLLDDRTRSACGRGPWDGPLRIAVSRTRPPAFAEAVAEELRAELVPLGSAGYKTLAVVRGEVDA